VFLYDGSSDDAAGVKIRKFCAEHGCNEETTQRLVDIVDGVSYHKV